MKKRPPAAEENPSQISSLWNLFFGDKNSDMADPDDPLDGHDMAIEKRYFAGERERRRQQVQQHRDADPGRDGITSGLSAAPRRRAPAPQSHHAQQPTLSTTSYVAAARHAGLGPDADADGPPAPSDDNPRLRHRGTDDSGLVHAVSSMHVVRGNGRAEEVDIAGPELKQEVAVWENVMQTLAQKDGLTKVLNNITVLTRAQKLVHERKAKSLATVYEFTEIDATSRQEKVEPFPRTVEPLRALICACPDPTAVLKRLAVFFATKSDSFAKQFSMEAYYKQYKRDMAKQGQNNPPCSEIFGIFSVDIELEQKGSRKAAAKVVEPAHHHTSVSAAASVSVSARTAAVGQREGSEGVGLGTDKGLGEEKKDKQSEQPPAPDTHPHRITICVHWTKLTHILFQQIDRLMAKGTPEATHNAALIAMQIAMLLGQEHEQAPGQDIRLHEQIRFTFLMQACLQSGSALHQALMSDKPAEGFGSGFINFFSKTAFQYVEEFLRPIAASFKFEQEWWSKKILPAGSGSGAAAGAPSLGGEAKSQHQTYRHGHSHTSASSSLRHTAMPPPRPAQSLPDDAAGDDFALASAAGDPSSLGFSPGGTQSGKG